MERLGGQRTCSHAFPQCISISKRSIASFPIFFRCGWMGAEFFSVRTLHGHIRWCYGYVLHGKISEIQVSTVAYSLLERFCRVMKDKTVFFFRTSENLFREVTQRPNGLSGLVADTEVWAVREHWHCVTEGCSWPSPCPGGWPWPLL